MILDALLSECHTCADKVERGEARLMNASVEIAPPDPLPRADGSLPLPLI